MKMISRIKLTECPRDAMQGLHEFVPTQLKIKYIQKLIDTHFDIIDFGSFVSPKAIPQMRDTKEVLEALDLSNSNSKLLAIIANKRGALEAAGLSKISYLGFPFSISETFQLRNTNTTMEESLELITEIQNICFKAHKELIIYLSMAFGNPYGDVWNADIALQWVQQLQKLEIRTIALSDTIGVANPENIEYLFSNLVTEYPDVEFGSHFHTQPGQWEDKINAAYQAGCYRFDGAIRGFGGCPMAKDSLTGNMPMEHLIEYFGSRKLIDHILLPKFGLAFDFSDAIFGNYH